MRAAGIVITREFQLLKLRDGDLERSLNRAETRLAALVTRFRDPFEKGLTERIVLDHTTLNLVRMAKELGDEMQVRDRLQIPGDFPELGIGADLFEVRLCESLLIC